MRYVDIRTSTYGLLSVFLTLAVYYLVCKHFVCKCVLHVTQDGKYIYGYVSVKIIYKFKQPKNMRHDKEETKRCIYLSNCYLSSFPAVTLLKRWFLL